MSASKVSYEELTCRYRNSVCMETEVIGIMTAIDKAILNTDKVICENISRFDAPDRSLLCQNILAQLRNFVEYIVIKICSTDENVDPDDDYPERKRLLEGFKQKSGRLRFLCRFHNLLKISVSHYTPDPDVAERLMLKYYEFLIRIKSFLADKYGLVVLENIDDFPIDMDTDKKEYYCKIVEKIEKPCSVGKKHKDRYYIQRIKPFFIAGKVYYEVTFSGASDKASKFNRAIAFTSHDIMDNYAVDLYMHKEEIQVVGNRMEIFVIDSWRVSIRPCELDKLGNIVGKTEYKSKSNNKVYVELMKFVFRSNMNLLDLLESTDEFYCRVKERIIQDAQNTYLFGIFDLCRCVIKKNSPGANVLRYLLYTMNNDILKSSVGDHKCELLSSLFLKIECKPFDEMPFATSLPGHNPKIIDLLDCIPVDGREYEFLARHIKMNTECNDILFTDMEELKNFDNIDGLVSTYNTKLYCKHREARSIKKYSNNILYINEYAENCRFIIEKLRELGGSGIADYTSSIKNWLDNLSSIDDSKKRDVLLSLFSDSHVALIYGSAGTGKTTLIKFISDFYKEKRKLYLANTNTAVDNLKRRVKNGGCQHNCQFMTVRKFVSYAGREFANREFDILFLDECSTISNSDMRKVLENAKFELLVLVGDVYQIEAIRFGNWFSIARYLLSGSSVYELDNTYRSADKKLKKVWDMVRDIEDGMQEYIDKYGYSKCFDATIFEKNDKDEIVLCLNYDGLYGVNSINSFIQSCNDNKSVSLGVHVYKVGDPIVFGENNRFSSVVYNNLKGFIRGLEENESTIVFDVELDLSLNESYVLPLGFKNIGKTENGDSIVRFSVDKIVDTDNDGVDIGVPFQVAYAVSIHRAQGLEYDSVKIIISDEVADRISHDVFYTAITRTRKKLQIYWSPEVEQKVLSGFRKDINRKRDANILKSLYSL